MVTATRNSSQENMRKRSSNHVLSEEVDVGGMKPSRSRQANIDKNNEDAQVRRSKRVRMESKRIIQQRQLEDMAATVHKSTTIVIPGRLVSASQISSTSSGSGSGYSSSSSSGPRSDKQDSQTRKALTVSIPLSKKGIRLSRTFPDENLKKVEDAAASKKAGPPATVESFNLTDDIRNLSDTSDTDISAYDTARSGDDDASSYYKNQEDRVKDFSDSDDDSFYDLSEIDDDDVKVHATKLSAPQSNKAQQQKTTKTTGSHESNTLNNNELHYGDDNPEKELEMFMSSDVGEMVLDELPIPGPQVTNSSNAKQSLALVWNDSDTAKQADDFSLWSQGLASSNFSSSSVNSASDVATVAPKNPTSSTITSTVSTPIIASVEQEEGIISLDDFLEYDDSSFSQPIDASNQSIWIERYSTIPIGGYRLRNTSPIEESVPHKHQGIPGFKRRSILTGKAAQMVSGFSYSYKYQ